LSLTKCEVKYSFDWSFIIEEKIHSLKDRYFKYNIVEIITWFVLLSIIYSSC